MKIQNHLQTKLQNAANNLCLAITYITLALYSKMTPEEVPALETMVAASITAALDDSTILSKDGYVLDAEKLIYNTTGIKATVTKQKISSIKDLPKDKYAAVNFEYNGNNHWVGAYGNEVIFNSLEFSNCFAYGKPVDARIIDFN